MAKRKGVRRQFGDRCRELREAKGLSQDDFAHATGLGRTYYGRVERGEINVCLDNIEAIARGLKVPIADLFDWDS